MFTTEQLLRFFADKEIQSVPLGAQSTVIHAIDRILDEMESEVKDNDSELSK